MIISAFYSGMRGGKMFADGLFHLLEDHGILAKAPEWLVKQPYNPDESYLDEIVTYGIFAVGFLFQIFNHFALPFPLNLVFFPLTLLEWILRWQITFMDVA
jgi:hypothetical protein